MKYTLVTLVLAFFIGSPASASQFKSVEQFENIYSMLNDLGDSHYWLNFTAKPQGEDMGKCAQSRNFKKVSVKNITEKMSEQIFEGAEIAYDGTDSYAEIGFQLEEATEQLNRELRKKDVRLCTDVSRPAYTDGHEVNVVKVNGKTLFMFEVAFPD